MKKLIILLMFVGLFGSSVYVEAAESTAVTSIQQSTAELITLITGMIRQAKDLTIKEAPDAIRQLLMYDFIGVVNMLLGMFIIAMAFILLYQYFNRKHVNKMNKDKEYARQLDWCDGGITLNITRWGMLIGSCVFSVIFVILLVVNIGTMIQIKVTPTAYLINKYVSGGR